MRVSCELCHSPPWSQTCWLLSNVCLELYQTQVPHKYQSNVYCHCLLHKLFKWRGGEWWLAQVAYLITVILTRTSFLLGRCQQCRRVIMCLRALNGCGIYICMCNCMGVCVCACWMCRCACGTYVCVYVCMCVRVYVCMCRCVYVCMCLRVYVSMKMCVWITALIN